MSLELITVISLLILVCAFGIGMIYMYAFKHKMEPPAPSPIGNPSDEEAAKDVVYTFKLDDSKVTLTHSGDLLKMAQIEWIRKRLEVSGKKKAESTQRPDAA